LSKKSFIDISYLIFKDCIPVFQGYNP
jgi:hypothetical protein